uniref:Arginine/serine-rich coiled-coil protein 2 n=1 Tax=Heterorhabditis bacteriophora TaxID=37862 RepID=A0A1I7XUX2_HETBA
MTQMGRRSRSPSSRSSRRRSRSGSRSPRGNRSRRRDEKDRSRDRDKEKKRDRSRDRDDRKSSRSEKSSSNTKKRNVELEMVLYLLEVNLVGYLWIRTNSERKLVCLYCFISLQKAIYSLCYILEDLSLNEQASRAREIDRIEEGGFQPAQFKSSAGGAGGRVYGHKQTKKETKADKVDQSEKDHDKAIFGPTWRNKEQAEKETAGKQDHGDIPLPVPISREPAPLIHPNVSSGVFYVLCAEIRQVHLFQFLTDINVRKQKWLEAWREQRSALGIV